MTNAQKSSDSQIQAAVQRELGWDTRVDATDIGVAVNGGVVTLTGAVDSWGKRLAAQEAAHRVAHVLDVANDLEVKLPGTSQKTDTEIAKAVRQALEWDVFVPDARIRSTVSHGRVTLEGDVDYSTEREDAGQAIRNLAGVVGVINRIEIKPPKASTLEVRDQIEHALARQAQREASAIELEVRDATVTVSGRVHSWAEREAVLGAAKGTRGVKNVESHLRIEPYAA
jgi:osmotically-inducible protein OsmY